MGGRTGGRVLTASCWRSDLGREQEDRIQVLPWALMCTSLAPRPGGWPFRTPSALGCQAVETQIDRSEHEGGRGKRGVLPLQPRAAGEAWLQRLFMHFMCRRESFVLCFSPELIKLPSMHFH